MRMNQKKEKEKKKKGTHQRMVAKEFTSEVYDMIMKVELDV